MNFAFFCNFPLQSRTKSSKKPTRPWTTTRTNGETTWLKLVFTFYLFTLRPFISQIDCWLITFANTDALHGAQMFPIHYPNLWLIACLGRCKFKIVSHVLTFASEYHVSTCVACFMLLFYGKHVYTVYCNLRSKIDTPLGVVWYLCAANNDFYSFSFYPTDYNGDYMQSSRSPPIRHPPGAFHNASHMFTRQNGLFICFASIISSLFIQRKYLNRWELIIADS